ncbi:MAG TPA: PAS domain S-box protein [Smithella sp.]|nr:PAS domain S-box protein [Smithella sp.]
MHSLIERQIKRYLKDIKPLPEEFQEFLKAVDAAYHENDRDRLMLERAFDLSSRELMQLNDELRKSEEKYRLIAENTADLIVVTDMNLRFTFISPSITRILGFTVEEAMNMTLDRILTPGSMRVLLKRFDEEMKLEAAGTADPDRIISMEFEEYKKDGSVICLESSISVQRDKENKPFRILAVNRDITKRKQAEKELINSEEKFRLLTETTASATYVVQGDKFRYVNPAFERLSGYTLRDLRELNFWDLVHPDFRELVRERGLARQRNENIPTRYEFKYVTKNGEARWLDLSATYIEFEGKQALMASGFDITERKQIEAALTESEIKYRHIFESFEDIYYQTDENGIIRVISPSVYRLTGWSPDELIGKPATFIYVQPEDREKLLAELSKNGLLRDYEALMKKKDGSQAFVSIMAGILNDPDGRPFLAGTLRDITGRKKADEKLQQTLESLRNAVGTTIQVMVSAIEMKDPYTAGHQIRSADLARAIALEMELPPEKVDGIRMAGSIHDIGKLSIPSEILSKPTKLSALEYSLIKEHPKSGYEMLRNVESPWPLADIVYQHHERMNGTGYPGGLKGDEILMEARILAVADVVEAMASHRPYRPSLGIEAALEEIENNKGILYDPAAADACLKLFREKGYQLSTERNPLPSPAR